MHYFKCYSCLKFVVSKNETLFQGCYTALLELIEEHKSIAIGVAAGTLVLQVTDCVVPH